MGSLISRTLRPRYVRVLILGLDAAGKTTMLNHIKLGRSSETIPTVGYNMESIKIRGVKYTFWDVGGQDQLREFWKHYYVGTHILAFVVDSSSPDTVDEAREALNGILMDPMMDSCVLLIYANKQDMPNSLTGREVAQKFELFDLRNRIWHVQPSCATNGIGIFEGIEWATKGVNRMKSMRTRLLA